MKWVNHCAIAAAITLPFNPSALPVALAGATAPDWLEWLLKAFGIPVKHRRETHYLSYILIALGFSFLLSEFSTFFLWFMIAYLSHWVCDALTITGVPISPLSKNNTTLFGGRIRTGEPKEYLLCFGILFFSLYIFSPSITNFLIQKQIQFNVYFMDYKRLNELSIIDNKEYLEKRFKFF
ncbi:metal-dependent hydrolase [Campylobacter coli]|nr:metal-dependent hydrolase [Campylobacter coli]ECC0152142.1 metal-dependent hydrolase [Campylobacter jejuni]EAH5626905.1 metal-dependent hydrolase [Campylobacter coli]EAH8133632.1 metal-dependent hydrolase [Campylobacter coli]EAI0187112.1 metal-dependent hydrolase [Campylobacter coli]